MHITPYEKGNIFNKDPLRPKKLLLHKKEIEKLSSKMKEKGFTIVPVEVYFKGSLVKVEIALAKGKKLYDKRADNSQEGSKSERHREISRLEILGRQLRLQDCSCKVKKVGL